MFGLSFQVLIKGLMGIFSHLTIGVLQGRRRSLEKSRVQSYNKSGSTSENHKGQRQGQAKEKFMESLMGEKSTKVDQLSQTQYVIGRKVIQHEKITCAFVKEEKSDTMNSLPPQPFHEEQRKMKEKIIVSFNEKQNNSISILGHLNYNLWNKIFEVIDSRLNSFKRGYDINMNRNDQEANELIHGTITRGRAMKIKAYDDSLAKGMVAFIEETMKNELNKKNEGFEDKEKPSKLLIIYTISKAHSMKQVGGEKNYECLIEVLQQGGDLGRFIMSTEGHIPSPSHQDGTNDPRRMNLNETLRSVQQSIKGFVKMILRNS
ncbi:hypothetical protein M9H77_08344 [Catharanthus roseus]|uniref:Uncharacterized protein n=1 Tax=Catharanthus roseus TaxID=4058 RepID=A0ACC0BXP1_CATRO|nr:hypothetical protein M9H77_08344 [Catharanthus roseus]